MWTAQCTKRHIPRRTTERSCRLFSKSSIEFKYKTPEKLIGKMVTSKREGSYGFEISEALVVVVVVGYPTPSEGLGHVGRPWSPRSRATPQGLNERSYRDRQSPKSERRKESVAGQCRMR